MDTPPSSRVPLSPHRLRWRQLACGLALAMGALTAAAAAPTVSLPAPAPAGITDQGASQPFATAVLTADNDLSVTIRFPKDNGTISAFPGLSSTLAGADIVYTLAAQGVSGAQGDLRALTYVPTANRIAITTSEVTTFRVQATDSVTAAVSTEATVSLTVTPVNDWPNLAFSGSLPRIYDNQTSKPFASATLTDPDAGDVLTATITYTAAHGVLVPGAGSPALTLGGSPGNYTVSGAVSSVESFLKLLDFNPTDNRLPVSPPGDTVESTTFSVVVRDLANATDFAGRSQQVESFNDTPQVAGTLPTSVPDNSAGAAIFTTFSVEDPDVVRVGGALVPQPVELTVDFGESAGSAGAGSLVGGNTTFVATGTAAPLPGDNEVTTALRALRYDPVANRVPVGQTSTVGFRLRARDSLGASLTSNLSFGVLSINDPPRLQASLRPVSVPDTGFIQPLTIQIADPDVGETFRVVIVPVNDPGAVNGVFEPFGFSPQTGSESQVIELMEGVIYRPVRNLSANSNITFRVQLTDLHPAPADPAEGTPVQSPLLTLTVTGRNDLPEIAVPANPVLRTTDDSSRTIRPFPSVGVSDPDSALLTVRLSIEGRTPGVFAVTLDGGVPVSGAPLQFQGTPEAVSRLIKTVTFRASPRPDRVVGEEDTSRLVINVSDGDGGTRTDRSTVLFVTAVNAAPAITGLPDLPDQPLRVDPATPGNPLRPFDSPATGSSPASEIVISDDDGTNITVTVRLDNPGKGVLETESHPISGYSASTLGKVIVASAGHGLVSGTTVRIAGYGGTPAYNGTHVVTVVDPGSFEIPVTYVDNAAPAGTWDRAVVADADRGVYSVTGLPAAVTAALRELQFVVNPDFLFSPAEPGRTRFLIEARDSGLNQASAELTIVIAEEPVNWLVTSDEDNGDAGTLRWALDQVAAGKAASAHVTFALPEYPAVIRLTQGPIAIGRNVTLKGPGADLLAISGDIGGDGLPDVQLFQIHAAVRMECLTLTHGAALEGLSLSGGAAYVGPTGELSLHACAVRDSVALQWGGGIDVDGGRLHLRDCLVRGNSTDPALGLGGGGVSLFTDRPCRIENTTFSGNLQGAPTGLGGGGLYVENATPASVLDVLVLHCTFAENDDRAPVGATALFANVFGSGVRVGNSIFADGQTRNLEVAGAASMISLGGNVSDDRTRTVLTQDGQPKEVFLLDHATDLTNVGGLVSLPIDEGLRPLPGYPLPRTSPAVGHAAAPGLPADQLGFWRDADPDAGALERLAGPRLVLNEIGFGPPSGLPDFLEFFVPRDAQDVTLDGMTIRVNGRTAYTFPANTTLATGHGLIVADTILTPVTCDPPDPDCPAPTPVLPLPSGETLGLEKRGVVELVRGDGEVLLRVDYVGQFVDPADPLDTARFDGTSITLAPQLRGCAWLPHGIVGPGPLDGGDFETPPTPPTPTSPPHSPGGTITTPFGSPNAFPFSVADAFIVDEDVAADLPVLVNDLEEDGQDRLIIVDVSGASGALTENDASATTALGGRVTLLPDDGVLRGASVLYDPQPSATLKALPVGYEALDTFHYTVADIGSGEIESIALSDGGTSSTLRVTGHRLADGEPVIISGSDAAAYNGTFAAMLVDDDHFKIAVPYAGNPAEPGRWETVNPRTPSTRSQAAVAVTVLGANDYPVPQPDFVSSSEADEDTPLRLMAGPSLAGIAADFDTDDDYAVRPRVGSITLLGGNPFPGAGPDTDPDTGETASLRVVGVVSAVNAISAYAAAADGDGVVVESTGHGLTQGEVVLISGYDGYSGYNGFHAVSIVDGDRFQIAVPYVDNASVKGFWAILTDANRLAATTGAGAAVRLEIRVDPLETSVVYDPHASAELNSLAVGEHREDTFYYAVADAHGAVSLGRVTIDVAGVNDAPVPNPDPVQLALLGTLPTDPVAISNLIASLDLAYYLPPDSGTAGRADLEVVAPGEPPVRLLLADIFRTDEATPLVLAGSDLTGNDTDVDATDVLQVASVDATSQAGAGLTLLGDGSVRYDPRGAPRIKALAREEPLLDVFSILVTDGETGLVPSWVVVLVTGVNDQPDARNDTASTNEDTPVTIDPLANDLDVDQDGNAPDNVLRLVPEEKITPLGARVVITPDSFTYDPTTSRDLPGFDLDGLALGETASESVVTTTMDGSFVFANDDHYQVAADGSGFVLDLATNDRNLTGVGRPVADYQGTPGQAPVRVVAPGHGLSSGMAVHIAGYAGAGLYARTHLIEVVDADSFTIPAAFVDNAATKGHWSALRIVEVTAPNRGGTVQIAPGAGAVIYSPEVNFVGDEVFAYSIEDDMGNRDGGVVSVRAVVNQLNGNLQANADRFSVARGQSPILDVLANDNIVPAPGQDLVLTRIVSQPVLLPGATVARDLVELVGNQIRFLQSSDGLPDGFPYEVRFEYEVSGGGTARAVAEVVVRVVDRHDTLPTRGDAFAVLAGSTDNTLDVLANDRVLPGSPEVLSVLEIVSPPASGTARLSEAGAAILYTPAAGFVGEVSFSYRATDNLGGTGVATVTVTVGGLTTSSDFVAVPFNDSNRFDDDAPVTVDVLANDPILGSPPVNLRLTEVEPADPGATPLGTLAIEPGGQWLVFTATPDQEGEREFIYTVADQSVPPRVATGRLVLIVARPSVRAGSDFFGVAVDSTRNPLSVLANDAAIPDRGRALTIVSVGTGVDAPDRGGTVTISETRDRLLYTPARGFVGEETFKYTMTDSRGTDTARVVVTVGAGRLVASADAFMVFFDAAGNREFTLPVLANDRVLPDDGETLVITGVGINDANGLNAPTEHGRVSISPDGTTLFYVANPGVLPGYTERFTYEISDGTARRAQAEVLVRVEDRTGARELETQDDFYTVDRDSAGNFLAVLANDGVKPAGASGWTITAVSAPTDPASGIATVSGGAIAFTPTPGFVGTATFSYDVSDGIGGTATALVTVKVGDLQLSPDAFAALSGSTGNLLDVLANDAIRPNTPDASADYRLASVSSPGDRGGLLAVQDGLVRYTPAGSGPYPYLETFEYVVRDDSGGEVVGRARVEVHELGTDRDDSEVLVTIIGVNDAPTLLGPVPGEWSITDKQPVTPFAGVVVGDVDSQGNEVLEVRVVLNDPAAGRLTSTGAFVETAYGSGAWVFTGTGAQATAAIQALVFVPTENYVPVPETWSFVFDIVVTDPHVTIPVAGAVTVHVEAVNDAPVISGTVPDQPVYYLGSIRPFASVLITEVDDRNAQPLTVGINFDATHGTLSGPAGFALVGPGEYVFQGTAAAATEAIRQIVFAPDTGDRLAGDLTPPPDSEETVFTITVDDGFAPPVVDNVTSVIAFHSLITKTYAGDGSKPDQYGYAVGASRTLVAVGAPRESDAGRDSGVAYVRSRDAGGTWNWGQVARLSATDPTLDARFGHSVSVSGERIAAGAPYAKNGSRVTGAAYVFEPSAAGAIDWQARAVKILAGDGAASDEFGQAVSLSGDFLAVGAPLDDDRGASSGAVYIFRRTAPLTWSQVAKIVPADGAAADRFGYAVSLHGEWLAIGAPSDADNGKDSGSAYLYRRSVATGASWSLVKKLLPTRPGGGTDVAAGDYYGFAVAVSDTAAVIGSPKDDDVGNDRGSAFIFGRNQGGSENWGQVVKLAPTQTLNTDQFGYSVTLDGDLAVVGMPFDGESNQSRWGSAWAYGRNEGGPNAWGLFEKLDPPDNTNNDEFGRSVAISCGTLVVGSRMDDTVALNAGSAYIYDLAFGKAPRVATPLPDRIAVVNELFSLVIPAGTFGDADVDDSVTLGVAASGGGALPGWLTFNAATRTLSGTPAGAHLGTTVTLVVTATDRCGGAASTPLVIRVLAARPPSLPPAGAPLTYEQWIARLLPTRILNDPALEATVWGRPANPDADPYTNFEEYAFGTRLFAASPDDGPGLAIAVAADGRVAVSYRRRSNDASLRFDLEFSPDLDAWTDAATLPKEEVYLAVGYDSEWVTCLLPADQLTPNLFFRVRISTL